MKKQFFLGLSPETLASSSNEEEIYGDSLELSLWTKKAMESTIGSDLKPTTMEKPFFLGLSQSSQAETLASSSNKEENYEALLELSLSIGVPIKNTTTKMDNINSSNQTSSLSTDSETKKVMESTFGSVSLPTTMPVMHACETRNLGKDSTLSSSLNEEENYGFSLELSLGIGVSNKSTATKLDNIKSSDQTSSLSTGSETKKVMESTIGSVSQPTTMSVMHACETRKLEKDSTLLKPDDPSYSTIIKGKKRKMILDNPCEASGSKPKEVQKSSRTGKVQRTESTLTRHRLSDDNEDIWKIKKTLMKSDVDNSSRVLLPKVLVKKHVIPQLDAQQARDCASMEGIRVRVFDCDTRTEHELTLKSWSTTSFVLISNWAEEFRKRRNLKIGDEIGLFWNSSTSQLYFSVLKRKASNLLVQI